MNSKKLRKEYMKLMPALNKVMAHVQDKLADLPPSDFILETNMKPYHSIKRKVEAEKIKSPTELSDLVRGRIFYSDQFNADNVMDILRTLFGGHIGDVDDNTNRSPEYGLEYHGIVHVHLTFDGIQFELQIMPIEFKPYKEFLHQIYEKFRDTKSREKLTDHQRDFLRKLHNKMYEKLDDGAQKNRESNPD